MCVIIYAPIGVEFDYEDLRDAFDYNNDGAGIGWIDNGVVSYSKGYTSFKDFINNMSSIIDDISMDRVIHFRITSRGKTSKNQCHPFLLSDNADDSKILDYAGTRTIMFMNGTISKQKLITGLNDTASFIIDTLYDSSLNYNNDADLNIINKLTNSKWAIMSTEGVSLVGDFTLMEGRYYSNTYHTLLRGYSYYDEQYDDYNGDYYLYDYYYEDKKDDASDDEEDYIFYHNENTYHYTLEDLVGDDVDFYEEKELTQNNNEALAKLFEDKDEARVPKIKNWFEGTFSSIKSLYGGK